MIIGSIEELEIGKRYTKQIYSVAKDAFLPVTPYVVLKEVTLQEFKGRLKREWTTEDERWARQPHAKFYLISVD